MTLKMKTLRRMGAAERLAFMHGLECHRRTIIRMCFFAIKLDVLLPLFNRPELEHITGWDKPRGEAPVS